MKIKNKKTKEIYEILGFTYTTGTDICLIGNVKTKEIKMIRCYDLTKNYEMI